MRATQKKYKAPSAKSTTTTTTTTPPDPSTSTSRPPSAKPTRTRQCASRPTASVATALRTKTGEVNMQQPKLQYASIAAPAGSRTDRLQPLLDVAALLMHVLPKTSEDKIHGAIGRYRRSLTYWGLTGPTEEATLAYVIARCCPPVGVPVPKDCETPVAPSTVAADVDALARACELAVEGMAVDDSAAFKGPRVRALMKSIGARMKRTQTSKRALLYKEVLAAWEKAEADGSPVAIRDAFAIVMAFFFGMRISELLALQPDDVDAIPLGGQETGMRVTFRQCKNRRSLLVQHQPFHVACAHPLLMRAWTTFEDCIEYYDDTPVFHRLSGATRDGLSRTWFDNVVKAAAPGTSPHSARVGLATELWAAGSGIDQIMAAGRWTSVAAVLYIIGSLDDQVKATRQIGEGLVYTGNDLRRLGTTPGQFARQSHRPVVRADAWAAIARKMED